MYSNLFKILKLSENIHIYLTFFLNLKKLKHEVHQVLSIECLRDKRDEE